MFKKTKKIVEDGVEDDVDIKIEPADTEIKKAEQEIKNDDDEWVWVNSYKGTDENMCCKGYQYELNKVHVMDGEVKLCESGFHCCKYLGDVFSYYALDGKNRFFRVRALININEEKRGNRYGYDRKLAAKEIEFISEITYEDLKEAINYYLPMVENSDEWDLLKSTTYEIFCIKKFIDKTKGTGISETLAIILNESTPSKNKLSLIKYIVALKNEKISKDMFIYLILKKCDELKITDGK